MPVVTGWEGVERGEASRARVHGRLSRCLASPSTPSPAYRRKERKRGDEPCLGGTHPSSHTPSPLAPGVAG